MLAALLGEEKRSVSIGQKMINFILSYGLMFALLLLIIVTSILNNTFLTPNNFKNILMQISVIGVVSCGMTFAVVGGGMDLSVGSVISLAGVISFSVLNATGNAFLAISAALLASMAVGAVNGFMLSAINGRIGEAFIITYGMQSVVGGVALMFTGGLFLSGSSKNVFYAHLGSGYVPILILAVIAAIMHFVLSKTKYGRTICFIGANLKVAKMSGIRVRLNRTLDYVICSLTAGIAAIVVTSMVNSASPLSGVGYELDALAAVVVGGTSLFGGKGSILKTMLGAVILGVLSNALNILGVTQYPQLMVKGTIIVLAVGLDGLDKMITIRGMSK
jgi:ribose/xylose/arabinose/galactoside ABC-type transport system permease subunit